MTQNERKLRDEKELLEALETLILNMVPGSDDWHRYSESINAKKTEVQQWEEKCQK